MIDENKTKKELVQEIQELRRREERYRSILEDIEEGCFELDLAGTFTFVNDAMCRVAGYSREELVGMNNREYASVDAAQKMFEVFNEIYRTGKPGYLDEFEVTTRDGSRRFGELYASLMLDAKGNPVGFRGVARDITERKKTEDVALRRQRSLEAILSSSPDAIITLDENHHVTEWNPGAQRIFGYTADEARGRNLDDLVTSPDSAEDARRYTNLVIGGDSMKPTEVIRHRKDGRPVHVIAAGSPIIIEGRLVGIVAFYTDITGRIEAEEALRESEERFRSIVEHSHDGIFIVNDRYQFIYVNDQFCRILGYACDEIRGRDFREYLTRESRDIVIERYLKRRRGEDVPPRYEFTIVRKDGQTRVIQISLSLVTGQGANTRTIGQILDITEQREAENALRRSEEKYRTILASIEDCYFEVDLAGRFIFLNDAVEKISGIPAGALIGLSNLDYTSPETAKKMYRIFNEMYETGEPAKINDYEIIRPDGTTRFTELTASLMRDEKGTPIGFRGIARDVTDRKRAEEEIRRSEEKYRTILESMQEGYFEVDLAGNITFCNDSACNIIGYPREEFIGMNNREYATPETAKRIFDLFSEMYHTGNAIDITDYEILRKDGTPRILEMSSAVIRDLQGEPVGFRGVVRDMTDRKRAEEQIRRSLKEKDVMLQEIHHRVKNNLQIVSSMLSLQSNYISDPESLRLFRDSENRVRSMALIHEKLYRSADLGHIEFGDYIESLTDRLYMIYNADPSRIGLIYDIEKGVFFGIETAIPCALIVNELVSNALKHAFPEDRKGQVVIDLHSKGEGAFALTVKDDGVGMPPHVTFNAIETLGMQLVSDLVYQLGGSVEIDRTGGTTVVVRFQEMQYRKRL
ncbi:MAG: PAS domain S-box protein [Deltaproteobacteria bacterium]|nr:PAS domain S-box protein [Deltaproteobacteria bacterium]